MITSELLDDILLEWSYRLKDGIPDVNDPEKVKVLNEVLVEYKLPLYESSFNLEKIVDPKYYQAWLDRIDKKMPFKVEGETTEFIIDPNSDFAKNFKNTKGKKDELIKLFRDKNNSKYANVIPGKDGPGPNGEYPLSKISKEPFTAKITTSGISDLNTAEAKEGMVVYFYNCTDAELEEISKKIFLEDPSLQLNLNKSKAQTKYLGSKSKEIIDNVIDFLNTQTINKKEHDTELKFLLNSLSAAYTIRSFWGDSYTMDRGELFTDIRKTASTITGIPEDKWCPGDVYLYVDESKARNMQVEADKSGQVVTIDDGGKAINGINTIFNPDDPAAFAISLKEEAHLAGGATKFLNIEKISSDDLGETATTRFTKEEKELIIDLDYAEKQKTTVKNVNSLLQKYKSEHDALIAELENDIKSKSKIKHVTLSPGSQTEDAELSKNKQLYNLIKKNVGLKSMIEFFNNFDKMSKKLASKNPIIAKYKNPLAALTAFGVSLSGFNPTFYKVVAKKDGTLGHLDEFKGRDTLEMLDDSVDIIDSIGKAGYQIVYETKMGKKTYSTVLDVRFKGKFEFTITVQEFKEKK